MPPILEIGAAIAVIFGAVLGAAFALWKWVEGLIKDLRSDVHSEIEKVNKKVDELEKTTVSKDDHKASMEGMNRALDNITIALRETGATLTSRIDLVLFEVGKKRNGSSDS